MIHLRRLLLSLLLLAVSAVPSMAQADDPDRDPNDSQPDFYVATLPTNLRLPKNTFNFRLTHRFLSPLGDGDFGDLAGRLFGLDSGAQIGLDLKYGLARGLHVGVYRTSDRTIQLSGQYNVLRDAAAPIGVGVLVGVEGTDNFTEEYSPNVALVLSRELGDRGAVYFVPSFVGNANITDVEDDDDHTIVAGLGARLRFARNSYVFVEGSPRVAGYHRRDGLISFGFEQRYGGHVFQLNFSNGFATTPGQVARGGISNDNWYFGFNLARKFY